jgi:hypothetical protein
MGFNAVADQFRKWKRHSQSRDLPSSGTPGSHNLRQQQQLNYLENGRTLAAAATAAAATTTAAAASAADPSSPPALLNKKLRKPPPTKQYPPSPDSYLQGIGDYTFIRQVGQGKFSRVMLSFHCLTKKQVAVKVKKKKKKKKKKEIIIIKG